MSKVLYDVGTATGGPGNARVVAEKSKMHGGVLFGICNIGHLRQQSLKSKGMYYYGEIFIRNSGDVCVNKHTQVSEKSLCLLFQHPRIINYLIMKQLMMQESLLARDGGHN